MKLAEEREAKAPENSNDPLPAARTTVALCHLGSDRRPVGKGADARFEGLGATYQTDEHISGRHRPTLDRRPGRNAGRQLVNLARVRGSGIRRTVRSMRSGGGILPQTSSRLRLG
jgi:hypothetical protein